MNRIESNRNRIALHRDRGESYRIALVAASYVSLMYRIVGYASRCVSSIPIGICMMRYFM